MTWQATLGWTQSNDLKSTKRKYLDLARKLHPNKNPSKTATEDFQALGKAWDAAQKYYRGGSPSPVTAPGGGPQRRTNPAANFAARYARWESNKRARKQNTREAVLPKDFVAGNGQPVRFEFTFGASTKTGDVPASRSGHVLGKDIFTTATKVFARQLHIWFLRKGLPRSQWSITLQGGSGGAGQYVHNRYYRPRTVGQKEARVHVVDMTANKSARFPEYYGWHANFNFPAAVENPSPTPPRRQASPGPKKAPKWEKPPPPVANGPPIQFQFTFHGRKKTGSPIADTVRSAAVPASPAGEVLGQDVYKVAARLFRNELREEFVVLGIPMERRNIFVQRESNWDVVQPDRHYKPKSDRERKISVSASQNGRPCSDKKKTWNSAW